VFKYEVICLENVHFSAVCNESGELCLTWLNTYIIQG